MDAQTEYYIRKYNNLIEQIKKLEYENKLLEDLTAGGVVSGPGSSSGSGSSLDDDDFSTTTGPGSGSGTGSGSGSGTGSGTGSGSGSGTNPDIGGPDIGRPDIPPISYRLRGTRLVDAGLDSRRQIFEIYK